MVQCVDPEVQWPKSDAGLQHRPRGQEQVTHISVSPLPWGQFPGQRPCRELIYAKGLDSAWHTGYIVEEFTVLIVLLPFSF